MFRVVDCISPVSIKDGDEAVKDVSCARSQAWQRGYVPAFANQTPKVLFETLATRCTVTPAPAVIAQK